MRIGKLKVSHYINYFVIGLLTLVLGVIALAGGRFDNSLLFLLEKIAISIILAVSLSLVVGFLGELSLGHAGFMCVGAYLGGKVATLLVPVLGNGILAFLVSLVVGCGAAAICGVIIGPFIRNIENWAADSHSIFAACYCPSANGVAVLSCGLCRIAKSVGVSISCIGIPANRYRVHSFCLAIDTKRHSFFGCCFCLITE